MNIINLSFTDSEMVQFLESKGYLVINENREFRTNSMMQDDPEFYTVPVYAIYKDFQEILVPDEFDYRMKSALLKNTFEQLLKARLLNL